MNDHEVIVGVDDSNRNYLEAKKHSFQFEQHIKLCVAFVICAFIAFEKSGDIQSEITDASSNLELLFSIFAGISAINYIVAMMHRAKARVAFEKLKKELIRQ